MKLRVLTFALLIIPHTGFAARPFVTDDARLTTDGSCQLESWLRIYPDSKELWALPACNLTGNLELTVGSGGASDAGESTTVDYAFQAKTLFRPLTSNDWGIGLALGTIQHPESRPGPNGLGNTYAYIPLSLSLNDDRFIVHANLGWLRDKASGRQSASWGIGAEFKVHPEVLGIAETYGDNHGTSYGHLGIRYSVILDLLQIDATYGRQWTGPGESRWVSVGMRYTPQKFF